MGAINFSYKNRCVVVQDDDYEWGNVPERGELVCNDRNYPSYELTAYKDHFLAYQIILTAGYYEGACIDYVKSDYMDDLFYDIDLLEEEDTDFFNEIVKRIMEDFKEYTPDEERIREGLASAQRNGYRDEALSDYLYTLEVSSVNKTIDKIKEEYGYDEIQCIGRFSNGEGVYKRVG